MGAQFKSTFNQPVLLAIAAAFGTPVTAAGALYDPANADPLLGFTDTDADAGDMVNVIASGSAVVVAGAAIIQGQQLTIVSGKAVPGTSTPRLLIALESAAANQPFEVFLG